MKKSSITKITVIKGNNIDNDIVEMAKPLKNKEEKVNERNNE